MAVRWTIKEMLKMVEKKDAVDVENEGEIAGKPSLGKRAGDTQLLVSIKTYVEMKARRAQLEILHGILLSASKCPEGSAIFPHIKGDVNILAALNRVNNVNVVECASLEFKIKELLVEAFSE